MCTFRFARADARTAISRSPCAALCRPRHMSTRSGANSKFALKRAHGPSTRSTSAAARPRASAATVSRDCSTCCAHDSISCPTPRSRSRPIRRTLRRTSVRAWGAAGVNRLSIGAQSFDDRVLAWMHRTHDAAATVRAVEVARDNGIENLSLDLIFALPVEIERAWERDVERAIALGPDHSVSLRAHDRAAHATRPLAGARRRRCVSGRTIRIRVLVCASCTHRLAKFDHYEVSNFGRPGRRARHNSSYWTHAEYAGIGPSSHGFDGTRRRWNVSAYADWTQRIAAGTDPLDADEETHGAPIESPSRSIWDFEPRPDCRLAAGKSTRAQKWEAAGWGNLDARGHLTLTALGWLRLDALASDLTLVRSH